MIVYTGGTFDICHVGHVNFLKMCKEHFPGCRLVVGLNTDEFILEYKKKPAVFNYEERKSHLMLVEYVDEVIPNTGGADSKPAILESEADVVAIGQDWLVKDYCKQMGFTSQWLTDNHIALIYIPHTDGISSSLIKEKIK